MAVKAGLKYERQRITHVTRRKRKDVLGIFHATVEKDGVRAAARPRRAGLRAASGGGEPGREDRERLVRDQDRGPDGADAARGLSPRDGTRTDGTARPRKRPGNVVCVPRTDTDELLDAQHAAAVGYRILQSRRRTEGNLHDAAL